MSSLLVCVLKRVAVDEGVRLWGLGLGCKCKI